MENNKSMEVFAKAPIRKAVLQNALPAMAAMLMVLIYNLADTFFIGQTHDDLQVAAVSLRRLVIIYYEDAQTSENPVFSQPFRSFSSCFFVSDLL